MRIAITALIAAVSLYAELSTSFVVPGGELVAGGNPGVIRPLVGIRGSRLVGTSVGSLKNGTAAPGGGFAIVQDTGGLSLIRSGGGAASLYLRPAAQQVSFSATGASAAFLESASSTVEVWTGFPSAPRLQATLSAAGPSGVLSAIEVSDDGEICVGVSESGDVYQLSEGNAPRRSTLSRQIRKARFLPRTRDLLILDADGQLSTANLTTGDIRPLPGVANSNFQDVVVATDGGSAVLVSDTSLILVPLDGKEPTTLPWQRGAARIGPLRDGEFSITVAGEPGAWILNRDVTLTYVAEK